MNELISVVLPVYKEKIEWVQSSIMSILNQTYRNLELVIGIDIPDREDVKEWLSGLEDDRVSFYINNNNLGIVHNMNKALELCHGQYIARMDADDVSFEGRFEKQIEYLKKEHLDLVATNVVRIDNEGNRIGKTNIAFLKEKDGFYLKRLKGLPHPTWLARKEVYENLKGYRDIELAEDYDFLIRCHLTGFKMGIIKEPLLYYRQNLMGITQRDKGKQRVTALILREQIKEGRIKEISTINTLIADRDRVIQMYRKYYTYSRYIRRILQKKEFVSNRVVLDFRVPYIYFAIKDFVVTNF